MTETTPREGLDRGAPATQSSLTDLVSGILSDAQTLIKQQATMLRAEIKEDFRRTGDVAKYMSVGAVLATLGGLFLLIGLVHTLHYFVPTLDISACWCIFGALMIAAGVAAMYAGKRILARYNPLPDKTLNALEENLTWKTTTPRS